MQSRASKSNSTHVVRVSNHCHQSSKSVRRAALIASLAAGLSAATGVNLFADAPSTAPTTLQLQAPLSSTLKMKPARKTWETPAPNSTNAATSTPKSALGESSDSGSKSTAGPMALLGPMTLLGPANRSTQSSPAIPRSQPSKHERVINAHPASARLQTRTQAAESLPTLPKANGTVAIQPATPTAPSHVSAVSTHQGVPAKPTAVRSTTNSSSAGGANPASAANQNSSTSNADANATQQSPLTNRWKGRNLFTKPTLSGQSQPSSVTRNAPSNSQSSSNATGPRFSKPVSQGGWVARDAINRIAPLRDPQPETSVPSKVAPQATGQPEVARDTSIPSLPKKTNPNSDSSTTDSLVEAPSAPLGGSDRVPAANDTAAKPLKATKDATGADAGTLSDDSKTLERSTSTMHSRDEDLPVLPPPASKSTVAAPQVSPEKASPLASTPSAALDSESDAESSEPAAAPSTATDQLAESIPLDAPNSNDAEPLASASKNPKLQPLTDPGSASLVEVGESPNETPDSDDTEPAPANTTPQKTPLLSTPAEGVAAKRQGGVTAPKRSAIVRRDPIDPRRDTRAADDRKPLRDTVASNPYSASQRRAASASVGDLPTRDTSDRTESAATIPDGPLDYTGRPASPIRLTRDVARLRPGIEKTLRYFYQRPENAPGRSNWGMMHSIMVYGVDTKVQVGRKHYNAIAWIAGNNLCRGQRLLTQDSQGIKAKSGVGLQGHQAQFLAVLSLCNVPRQYQLYAGKTAYTVEDLIRQEMKSCKYGEELTFSLIGLAHYLDTDQTWTSSDGQQWDFERLIASELEQPIVGTAWRGTHRLMGYGHALRKRRAEGKPITGTLVASREIH